METKTFDYKVWLSKLKVGDEVRCNRNIFTVVGEEPDTIFVDVSGNIRLFSRSNGKELGNRPGYFKDASIYPYTDEDKAKAKKAEEEEKQQKEWSVASNNLMQRITGSNYTNYSCDRRLTLQQISCISDIVHWMLQGYSIDYQVNAKKAETLRDEKGRFVKK